MMFWVFAALLALCATTLALQPLWSGRRAAPSRAAHDVAVFKNQLKEVDRDFDRGVISEAEAEGARREISRRLLAAADAAEREGQIAPAPSTASNGALMSAGVLILIMTGGVYLTVGSPELPDRPLADRDFAAEREAAVLFQSEAERRFAENGGENRPTPLSNSAANASALTESVARLERLVAERPEDAESRRMLGRAYKHLGRPAEAWPLFAEAIALLGEEAPAGLYAEQGEAMALAAGGYVSREAREAFARAPQIPHSRYFLSLAALQDGFVRGALEGWILLLRDYPDAPFAAHVREQIVTTAAGANLQVRPGVLPPTSGDAAGPQPSAEDVAEMSALPADARRERIEIMVASLADRLADDPDDLEGWLRLIRSYGVLGDREAAKRAFADAVNAHQDDAQSLEVLDAAARNAGVDPDAL